MRISLNLRPLLHAAVASGLLAGLLLAGCKSDPTGPPPVVIPGPTETIIYSKHIQPIFTNSCGGTGCHLSNDNLNGVLLDSWEHLMSGAADYGAEIVPYSVAKSHLFQHINSDTTLSPVVEPVQRMPLARSPLPQEQVDAIRRWIAEGAKNDNGEVALGTPSRPRVYVAAQADDAVTVIDQATQLVARYIPVGSITGGAPESPHNLVLSPDGNYLYVNLIVAGMVEKYDAHTFAKLGSVRVGLSPAQIAITHDGSTLYVSNFDQTLAQTFVMRLNAATLTVTDTIFDVGLAPHGVTLSADEKYLYTTNAFSDDISEIDLSTLQVKRRFLATPDSPLPPSTKPLLQPYQSVISHDGRYLFFSCRVHSQVRVVDLTTGRVIDSIAVGTTPLVLNMTPDGREIWVPNQAAASLTVIDVASRSVVATITDLKQQPHAVGFSADGRTAFLSCENQNGNQHHATIGSSLAPGLVYVIDVATRRVIRSMEVGSFAAGVAVAG
ncbi:MAG TPA: beta-propeller fold lactonase family protein [Candidatus Kapabacteria bacterium]|nr:beta-propeller fold lactonase family protein [Candidatus Kapabacteria bacterium]